MQVHRQTAASVVQHMALGVAGLGCEDALTHLLNYVWPNIFETSPHVVNAVQGAVDGCRLALGPAIVLNYILQVFPQPQRIMHVCRAPGQHYTGIPPASSQRELDCSASSAAMPLMLPSIPGILHAVSPLLSIIWWARWQDRERGGGELYQS